MSAPETAVVALAAAEFAEVESEERHRLAVLAASGPLMLLLAPLVLPLDEKGPMLAVVLREPVALVFFACVFFWPLFIGALGLRRAMTRRAPGTAAFAVPAVIHLLGAAGLVVLLLQVLSDKWRARESPAVWAALGICLALLYVVGRGFRRKGWARFAQLTAGVWMLFLMGTLMIAAEAREMFDPPESGGWVLLFALSAAAPAVGSILTARRRRLSSPE